MARVGMALPSLNNVNGAVDRKFQDSWMEGIPSYAKRRLSNGLPIPVFASKIGENLSRQESQSLLQPNQDDSGTRIVKEYLSCPLCNNTCIETTSTNCGHKFCKNCIEKWRRQKPVCPTCHSLVTSVHRIYSDDLLIESHLDTLEPEVKAKFKRAQEKRLSKIMQERQSRSLLKKIRRKLDDYMVFLRCKSMTNLENKISSARSLVENQVRSWIPKLNFGLLLGVVLGACLVILANNLGAFCNFTQYLWLSIKRYNGVIPEYLLKDKFPSKAMITKVPLISHHHAAKSAFEVLVDNLNIFGWAFRRY